MTGTRIRGKPAKYCQCCRKIPDELFVVRDSRGHRQHRCGPCRDHIRNPLNRKVSK